jgi:DNA-binding CsgD family transcriptional regulator
MRSLAATALHSPGLRVWILAAEPVRSSELRKIVLDAGHEVVDRLQEADVVLSDGDFRSIEGCPVVTLGGTGTDHPGVLTREAGAKQIDAALHAVAAGLIVRSPGAPLPGFAAMEERALETLLTPREVEVLSLIVAGLTNKLIARRLDISLHTVKFHVESLFRKLGVRTRSEAVAKALERRRDETLAI